MRTTVSILLCALTLSGCVNLTTLPQKFPEAPPTLLSECENLESAPDNTTSIVELMKIVVQNYNRHQICAMKVEAWSEWYRAQRVIFNEQMK